MCVLVAANLIYNHPCAGSGWQELCVWFGTDAEFNAW